MIRPVEMSALRKDLIKFYGDFGAMLFKQAIEAGHQNMQPQGTPARAGKILADEEIKRLDEAELFFVSSDMTDLCIAAASSLPAFTAMPEDLPSPTGFMVFDKSIRTFDYADHGRPGAGRVAIHGAAWGPASPQLGPFVWVSWYSYNLDIPHMSLPRLMLETECMFPFSEDEAPTAVADGHGNSTPSSESDVPASELMTNILLRVLRTAWTLMKQPGVGVVSDLSYDRASRRRALRANEDLDVVRIITLRSVPSRGDSASDREWHHRWMVRGHWRMQPVGPARSERRPVWIMPHIKGPEGAPMLGGEKIYAWTR